MILVVVALALAMDAPPADPASDAAPTPPAPESAPDTAPAEITPPPSAPADPVDGLAPCKLLVDAAKLTDAEACFRAHAADDKSALALADVVAAWTLKSSVAGPSAPPVPTLTEPVHNDRRKISLQDLVASGKAEGLVWGSLAGAGGGFLGAATYFAAARTNQNDSLPWLIASPALGALAGAAGTFVIMDNTRPTVGDIRLTTSTTLMGAAQGVALQLAVFDQNQDVSAVPLRFATVLGGGLLGLGSGIFLSPFVDITDGDVAVANSAALWGGVFSGFGLAFAQSSNANLTLPQGTLIVAASTFIPYATALALHPYIRIERWPSLLIEAGGAAGFLVTSAFVTVLSTSGVFTSAQPVIAVLGGGTFAGVALGGVSAYFVSEATRAPPDAAAPAVVPTVLLDDHARAVPGVAVVGRF